MSEYTEYLEEYFARSLINFAQYFIPVRVRISDEEHFRNSYTARRKHHNLQQLVPGGRQGKSEVHSALVKVDKLIIPPPFLLEEYSQTSP